MAIMTMTPGNGYIDGDVYFEWLCRKVGVGPYRPYKKLLAELHRTAFRPATVIDTDMNRAADGLRIRGNFIEMYGDVGSAANRGQCTMLELLISLAKSMDFLLTGEDEPKNVKVYFWTLIKNLHLDIATDEKYDKLNGETLVRNTIQRVLTRTYSPNGNGGIFPLKRSKEDQRHVEIWYQMHAWLNENYIVGID